MKLSHIMGVLLCPEFDGVVVVVVGSSLLKI
jgi:hypothetical protein